MTYDLATPSVARLWDHSPDWSARYEVTRSFLTDIITSRSNLEQRRALRDTPRLTARYQAVVSDEERASANRFMRAWQNKPTAMPDYSRHALLTGSSAAGDSSLTLASPPSWLAAGQLAVLCGDTCELVEIDEAAGATLSLADPLANAWASGAVIRPALFGLLDGQTPSTRFHRGAASISVTMSAYPGGEPPEDEGTASDTFNGYEVFTAEPNWAASPSLAYLWPVEQVDYGIGRTAQFRPVDRGEQLVEAEFADLSPAEAQGIEQAFLRAKGRRGAFYRPSGEKDMVLAADVSASLTFDAVGTDLADDFGSFDYASNDVAIEICQTDGTRLRRLISGIAVDSGNSRVTLNAAVTLTRATTARISWMPLVRFASDDLTTSWITPLTAAIRTSFQSVKA